MTTEFFPGPGRYTGIEIATLETPEGPVAYLKRRVLPPAASLPLDAMVVALPMERLDGLAWRCFEDAEKSWLLCDANDAMDPAALIAERDGQLRVPFSSTFAGGTR